MSAELDRLRARVTLVRVHHQGEVAVDCRASSTHSLRVLCRAQATHFEFAACKSHRHVLLHQLSNFSEVQVVVPTDHADRNSVATGTPQSMDWRVVRPRKNVPDCRVYAGYGLKRQAAVTKNVVGSGLHCLPTPFRVSRRPTPQQRRQFVMDNRQDPILVCVGITVKDFTRDTRVRFETSHNRASVFPILSAAGVTPCKRNTHSNCLDLSNG